MFDLHELTRQSSLMLMCSVKSFCLSLPGSLLVVYQYDSAAFKHIYINMEGVYQTFNPKGFTVRTSVRRKRSYNIEPRDKH